jgi:hypothetical protein
VSDFKKTFYTADPVDAFKKLNERLYPYIKPWLVAGHKVKITVDTATRNNEQNAKLHAMLADIADQKNWAGKRRDVTTWKRLMVSAWLRTRGDHVEVLPALDGHGIEVIYEHTSELSIKDCKELIHYIEAWAVTNDIKLNDGLDL